MTPVLLLLLPLLFLAALLSVHRRRARAEAVARLPPGQRAAYARIAASRLAGRRR